VLNIKLSGPGQGKPGSPINKKIFIPPKYPLKSKIHFLITPITPIAKK
jgi:hypothetical protein